MLVKVLHRASKILKMNCAREAEGSTHQAELKGVEEYAIECSILKCSF
jgi:hypothetical protein